MVHVECLVVGAGAVGLAVAAAVARRGMETVVLERHDKIGQEVSSHNSEVIHAGIYYPKDSLKARLCVRGKAMLYEHCEHFNVPHSRLGKIITASSHDQLREVRALMQCGKDNGVSDLSWLNPEEIAELEPRLESAGGVLSPSTGILDSHAYMHSLQAEFERFDGTVVFNTAVKQLREADGKVLVSGDEAEVTCDWLINCGGLGALEIAQPSEGLPAPRYAKGHYYTYSGESPFSKLIYPVPDGEGLGIHVTLDLAGNTRFGPDVHWVPHVDYEFDTNTLASFVSAIRSYYPDLDTQRLQPGYTGVRPKVADPGSGFMDFQILGPQDHGFAGCINLLGIESPGLTASLAIAEHVAGQLGLANQAPA